MKKNCLGTMLALLIVVVLVWSVKLPTVKAWTGTIYIRADGSIDPPSTPIVTFDNVTYTLTDNIASTDNGIVIERSNITLDGNGYTIQGNMTVGKAGIYWSRLDNVTIRNTNINNFVYGIQPFSSSHSYIWTNNLTENRYGIEFWGEVNSSVFGNSLLENQWSIHLTTSPSNNISGNNIANSAGYGIWLKESTGNALSHNNVTDNGQSAIFLQDMSDNNTVSDNNIVNTRYGIYLEHSAGNILRGNKIAKSTIAFVMRWTSYHFSYNNVVFHNSVTECNRAVYLSEESVNNVWDNGYPSGGNYWSDYNGTDVNQDGMGDTPYVIDADNVDHYPLMTQYTIPEFPSFLVLPLIFTATLLAAIIYSRMKLTRKFVRGN